MNFCSDNLQIIRQIPVIDFEKNPLCTGDRIGYSQLAPEISCKIDSSGGGQYMPPGYRPNKPSLLAGEINNLLDIGSNPDPEPWNDLPESVRLV